MYPYLSKGWLSDDFPVPWHGLAQAVISPGLVCSCRPSTFPVVDLAGYSIETVSMASSIKSSYVS